MKFKTGDRVKYAPAFLASIGMGRSDMRQERGVIESARPLGSGNQHVKVRWDGEAESKGAVGSNLAKA